MATSMAAILSSPASTTTPASTFSLLRNNSPTLPPPPLSVSMIRPSTTTTRSSSRFIRCEVAVKSDSSTSIGGEDDDDNDEELKRKLEAVGSRVRVLAPLKLYHVPRVPEVELKAGTEGIIKNYVGFWKGKRISANFPYKVEFQIEIEGRGLVKVSAHLKEDEFEII